MKFFWFLLLLLSAATLSYGMGEEELPSYEDQLLKYRTEQSHSHLMITSDQLHLHYRAYLKVSPPSQEAIVLLPGVGESELQYLELAFDLNEVPVDLYIVDHRGQGLSDSELLDEFQMIHTEAFTNYFRDCADLVEVIAARGGYERIHLLGHALGAHVALGVLVYYPHLPIRHTALISPQLSHHWTDGLRRAYLRLTRGFWGLLPYWGETFQPNWHSDFANNNVTHSRSRYELLIRLREEYPQLYRSSVSNTWVLEMIESSWDLENKLRYIDKPMMFLSGDASHPGLRGFCRRSDNCAQQQFSGATSALLWEADDYRNPTLDYVMDFFSQP